MPKVVKEKKTSFDKLEEPFYIKCDVHPWMKTWVGVFDHPYFATTDDNGNYKIENIPPGEYNVIAWHEMDAKFEELTIAPIEKDLINKELSNKDYLEKKDKYANALITKLKKLFPNIKQNIIHQQNIHHLNYHRPVLAKAW